MKKKIILFLISTVLPFCCSSCGIIDIAAQLSNADSSETKISSEEEFNNYVEQQFEEKYGKKFELIGFSSPFMSISRNCDIKCVDDGIEFQATVHSKDYYEIERENYLCYKYVNEIENDVENYVSKYFTDFKLVRFNMTGSKLPFDTEPNLDYEKLKKIMIKNSVRLQYGIIFNNTIKLSSEQEKSINNDILRRYEDNTDVDFFRAEINLNVSFGVYRFSEDIYDEMSCHINEEQFHQYKSAK